MDAPLLLAIAALITAVGTAFIAPVRDWLKSRADKQPKSTEIRAQDTASNEFLLTLVKYSKDEVDRWKDAYDASSAENADLKQKLLENVRKAEETEMRMHMAVDYLIALARDRQSVTSSEVVRWATIALDHSIPIDDFRRLMGDHDDIDDTIIPT
jgi:hypothetical protein